MTLRARLALGIFVIGVLLLVPLLLATSSLEQVGQRTRSLRTDDFSASTLLGRLRVASDEFLDAELTLGVDTAPAFVYPRVDIALRSMDDLADSLPAVGLEKASRDVNTVVATLRRLSERELQALLARNTARAEAISADSVPAVMGRLAQLIRGMELTVDARTASRVDTSAALIAGAQERTAMAFALAAALAAIVAALLTWAISRPVRALEEGMARVADGEFDHRLGIAEGRKDEFGRLAQSYTVMAQQLAALDKLKAEVVSVASHELKTPINVILGYVQLLQEGVYGDLPARQREVLETIEAQGHTLTRLVRQLLDISRFEAGVGRLEPRPFVLFDFLADLERAFDVLAHQREVRFIVSTAPGVPDAVTWDPDRMNEVLGNLLANAFKFTGRGGRVELNVEAAEDRILLQVSDTGAGIRPEQLPRIFDKFFQADNQAAASAKGTGLGLAIAKSIVEAHGGTITCDSTPGVGTTFTIDLPARVATRRAGTPRVQTAQPAGR